MGGGGGIKILIHQNYRTLDLYVREIVSSDTESRSESLRNVEAGVEQLSVLGPVMYYFIYISKLST